MKNNKKVKIVPSKQHKGQLNKKRHKDNPIKIIYRHHYQKYQFKVQLKSH